MGSTASVVESPERFEDIHSASAAIFPRTFTGFKLTVAKFCHHSQLCSALVAQPHRLNKESLPLDYRWSGEQRAAQLLRDIWPEFGHKSNRPSNCEHRPFMNSLERFSGRISGDALEFSFELCCPGSGHDLGRVHGSRFTIGVAGRDLLIGDKLALEKEYPRVHGTAIDVRGRSSRLARGDQEPARRLAGQEKPRRYESGAGLAAGCLVGVRFGWAVATGRQSDTFWFVGQRRR